MRSRLAVIVSAVAGVALAAPGIKDAPAKPDPLVGVWTLESVAFGGQVRPDPDALRWEFKSDGKYVKHRGEQRTEFRYSRDPKTDANATNPKST